MKKILLFFALLFGTAAHAGPMANVEYIHAVIKQQWGIEVPYNPSLTNPKVAANMKYLLTAVDVANKMLNGEATTDYGNSEYATMYAADTIATNDAVKRLIKKQAAQPQFFVTTRVGTRSVEFYIVAAGNFTIDWGDGTIEEITRTNTTEDFLYSHTYSSILSHTIGIGGRATEYNVDPIMPAISFVYATWVGRISGSLGAVFPTIGDGSQPGQQPSFTETFLECSNLSGEIPENLFAGVHGAPVEWMFCGTFYGCPNLSGSIPENLFAGIKGTPAPSMFMQTFWGCEKLSGSIPGDLFAGIEGVPAPSMFMQTFWGCNKLSGDIPANLFAGIEGVPAADMFNGTFANCLELSGSIPGNLFANISGAPATNMFSGTFSYCKGLSGCIQDGLFAGIDATLEYIVNKYAPFSDSGITTVLCSEQSELIDSIERKFFITTASTTSSFSFKMSAKGIFVIDWGDGNSELITRSSTTEDTYSHTYATAGEYKIGIGGTATEYDRYNSHAAISFTKSIDTGGAYTDIPNTDIAKIEGSLGAIFPTIGDGSASGQQPSFRRTFQYCTFIDSIPENLFAGVSGAPVSRMFYGTFEGCSRLTAIPENLFGKLEGAAQDNMFFATFRNCTKLSGPSAQINGKYLYEIWPDATSAQVRNCYWGATGLSDYSSIPANWK